MHTYLPAEQSTGVLNSLVLQSFSFFVTHIVGWMIIQHVSRQQVAALIEWRKEGRVMSVDVEEMHVLQKLQESWISYGGEMKLKDQLDKQ